eukprot:CAMPEP_0168318918 /NCGR_PEP_ID=MMETSP0213-20121227/754_1 /TAXON_ID=151035 /ORGANISM="Euplotes harpa, Strain FSP1.4" /LENGTH=185 /DNA_ID=CAMNT_0008320055 /DNA_START=524 /DNA_END=1082 /DNA_ORIENTATION=-
MPQTEGVLQADHRVRPVDPAGKSRAGRAALAEELGSEHQREGGKVPGLRTGHEYFRVFVQIEHELVVSTNIRGLRDTADGLCQNQVGEEDEGKKNFDIVELVTLWRKLYNGIPDNKGNLLRYSLDDAAKKVGVSKKSLDDYLLQLRFGRKLGFDFEKHKDDSVGTLRKFVKSHKSLIKAKGKVRT